jgi:flagellar biosynthesis protein FlhG
MSTQLVTEERPASGNIVLNGSMPSTAIWPIAGGKGGTGKSTLTANIGVGLSLLGYKVVLVDCDLGGADLHLFFDQIAPARSLSHFLTKETATLKEVLLPTPSENLKLICGGNEMIGLANLPYVVKEKLVRHIMKLDADFVLIDLGAGTAFNTLDFFTLSDDGLIVCTPEPHARVDAYGFIKNTVYRKLRRKFAKNEAVKATIEQFARKSGRKSGRISELLKLITETESEAGISAKALMASYHPRLILNRVRYKRQIEEAHRFVALVKEFLSTEMDYVGYVRSDMKILDACERRRPLMIDNPKAPASRDICTMLMQGLQIPDRLHRFEAESSRKMAEAAKAEAKYW